MLEVITPDKLTSLPYIKNGNNYDTQTVLNNLDIAFRADKANWIIARSTSEGNIELEIRKIEKDLRDGFIPNLSGMGIQDVLYLLENSSLQVVFSGNGSVKSQSMKKGVQFKNGSKIVLELS